jgi:hypothetical protein
VSPRGGLFAWNAFLDRMFESPCRAARLSRTGGLLELRLGCETAAPDLIDTAAHGERPHDSAGTSQCWSFKTLEQDEHTFPHAIEAAD